MNRENIMKLKEKIDKYLNENKERIDEQKVDKQKISAMLVRLFVGSGDETKKLLLKTPTGFKVDMDKLGDEKYNDLFRSYSQKFLKLLEQMEKDFK
jgi:hypothetical protein